MFRRYRMLATFSPFVMGGALALGLGGCSDSTPPPAPQSTPQPAPAEPEPATAKGKKDPTLDMGVKEKRELRRQQREAAAGKTP